MNIGGLRRDYRAGELRKSELSPDPIDQFGAWFREAQRCEAIPEPNAMTLATGATSGKVSARTVLLKGWDATGFRFFTNYTSAKARDLEENPRAALLFHWVPLERQVQICGPVERTSEEESESYFRSRPLGSRIGAWASRQSAELKSREELDSRYSELERKYADAEVPRPPFWGGYLVRPETVEFWQGRSSRLHDRFRYSRDDAGGWRIDRLAP